VKKILKYILFAIAFFGTTCFLFYLTTNVNTNPERKIGNPLDSLNGVVVYYNGGVREVEGKDSAYDYYLGLKYQCVEFVNRYYFEYYHHKMPDPYGNAVDFYNGSLKEGELNKKSNLIQFPNPGKVKPKEGDIVVFDKQPGNKYGHIAIISMVGNNEVEIIQQNAGAYGNSRAKFELEVKGDSSYYIKNRKLLGRLRMP